MTTYRKITLLLATLCFFIFLSHSGSVQALTTSTIYSTGDTYFTGDGHNNDNHGSDSYIRLKHPSAGFSHIALRFPQADIASALCSRRIVVLLFSK